MSVVARQTAGRWAVVAAAVAALCALPSVVSALPVDAPETSPEDLRALAASAPAAHQGLVEVDGRLGLPDLPRLGDVAALLGGTTRTRVWWRDEAHWRVDTLLRTGERGAVSTPAGVELWDFEESELLGVPSDGSPRLPRADDLTPPALARFLLGDTPSPDRVEALDDRRVAGRAANGIRVRVADARSTIAHVDVWLDGDSGVPLEVAVQGRSGGRPALRSRFLSFATGAPGDAVLDPPRAAELETRSGFRGDLLRFADENFPWALPDELAGLPRGGSPLRWRGVGVYGAGLARFVVVPLPGGLARPALEGVVNGGGADVELRGGEGASFRTPLLSAVVARERRGWQAYLIAGSTNTDVLTAAAQQLLDEPPGDS